MGLQVGPSCWTFVPDSLSSLFPATIDLDNSGFTKKDELRLIVKSPLVMGRSDPTFYLGTCIMTNVTKTTIYCQNVYSISFNWTQVWRDSCIPVVVALNGATKEYVMFLKVVLTEAFADMRKRDVYRTVTENLAFRVSLPINVALKSENETLLPPPDFSVSGIVISRQFDAFTHTGTVIVRTKTQKPAYLMLPTVSNSIAGVLSTITEIGDFHANCPNSSVDCVQEWLITTIVEPEQGVCRLDDTYSLKWNSTCHYPCWPSGENKF